MIVFECALCRVAIGTMDGSDEPMDNDDPRIDVAARLFIAHVTTVHGGRVPRELVGKIAVNLHVCPCTAHDPPDLVHANTNRLN